MMRKTDSSLLSATELFCKAAETLNFTAAARSLGTSPSAVSKAVRRLEDRLGVDLFQRTTRSIRLTENGRIYHADCRQALAQIEQSEDALRRGQADPSGVLRVSLPFSYGIKRIVPLLPRYLERHGGKVRLFIAHSNTLADFVADDIDLSIRIGRVPDSRLVARLLHNAQFRVVASPGYLQAHGRPLRPEDLSRHHCVDLVLPETGRPIPWQFATGGACREMRPASRLEFDHPLAALAAVLHGAGLTRLLDFTVDDDIRQGRLVEVLEDFRSPVQPVSALYPNNPHLSPKLRNFLDFLIEELDCDRPRTAADNDGRTAEGDPWA